MYMKVRYDCLILLYAYVGKSVVFVDINLLLHAYRSNRCFYNVSTQQVLGREWGGTFVNPFFGTTNMWYPGNSPHHQIQSAVLIHTNVYGRKYLLCLPLIHPSLFPLLKKNTLITIHTIFFFFCYSGFFSPTTLTVERQLKKL